MMRKLLLAGALIGCAGGAAPAAPPANYDAFGIALLQRLSAQSKGQNVFLSPLSIGMALSMAADGARGQTRSAMFHALGQTSNDLAHANAALMAAVRKNGDAQVGVANAIWVRQDIPPSASYVNLLKTYYGAQAQALQFGNPSAAAAINAWTKAHTLGLIPQIVGQTQRSDFAYLTNALAFTANWTLPFKKSDTRPRPFTNAAGQTQNVPTMSQTASFATLDSSSYRALRMTYGKGGYAAYILLPNQKNGAPNLIKNLSAKSFDSLVGLMKPQRLQVMLPAFTARYDTSLVPVLKALGMGIAFTDHADFSPIHVPPPGLTITDVHHSAYVRVDEKGTTAAAATSVTIGMTAVMAPPKQFIVDHPFVLALRDEQTGTLLFIGLINNVSS